MSASNIIFWRGFFWSIFPVYIHLFLAENILILLRCIVMPKKCTKWLFLCWGLCRFKVPWVRLWWSGWGRLWMFRQWWWLGSWNTGPWSKSICKRQSGWFHIIVAQMDQEWARTSFGKSFTTQKQMEPLSQMTIYQQRLRGGRFWCRRICYDASGCRPEPGFKHIRVL